MKATRFSDDVAVVAAIDPDVTAAGTVTSDWVDMSQFDEIMAIVQVGTLGTNATIDAGLEQATDGSGTGAKAVTGSAITQLTQADGDDDKQVVIQCNAEDLDVDGDFDHARLSITVAVATSDVGGIVLGRHPRYAPASDNDLTSVDEIVTC